MPPGCNRLVGLRPGKDTPASCGRHPALDEVSPIDLYGDDDSSASGENAPDPVDDALLVVDYFFSSRRLFS